MKPLFVTANGLYNQDVYRTFKHLIGKDISNLEACIITTADKIYKEKNVHAVRTKKILGDMGIGNVDFIDIEFEDAKKLERYDLIYINGGNPFYLLHQLRMTETDQLLTELRESRYITGHSAGAAILGTSIEHAMILHPEWNDMNLDDLSGLSWINGMILPHSNRYSDLDRRVVEMNPILLADNEYLLVT